MKVTCTAEYSILKRYSYVHFISGDNTWDRNTVEKLIALFDIFWVCGGSCIVFKGSG